MLVLISRFVNNMTIIKTCRTFLLFFENSCSFQNSSFLLFLFFQSYRKGYYCRQMKMFRLSLRVIQKMII